MHIQTIRKFKNDAQLDTTTIHDGVFIHVMIMMCVWCVRDVCVMRCDKKECACVCDVCIMYVWCINI